MKHIIKHWKTSLGGLLIITFTVMLGFKVITATEWIELIGTLVGVGLFAAKDFDKVKDQE